jgi:hypothetical protein
MKTPLQQLINYLETLRDEAEGLPGEVWAYEQSIEKAKGLIDYEKWIIQTAFLQGFEDDGERNITMSETVSKVESFFNDKHKLSRKII